MLECVASGIIVKGAEDGRAEFFGVLLAPFQKPGEVLMGDFVAAKEIRHFGGIEGANEADVDVVRGGGDGSVEVGKALVGPAGLEKQKDILGMDGAGTAVEGANFGVAGAFGVEILEEGQGFIGGVLIAIATEVAQNGSKVDAQVVVFGIGSEGGFELRAGAFLGRDVGAEIFQG